MLDSIKEYFSGRSISFEDAFNIKESQNLISKMKEELQLIMEGKLVFPKKRTKDDMLIKLVEPKSDEAKETRYTKSLHRMAHAETALQHKIFYNNEKKDKFDKTEARRILIELLVKDCLINRNMPSDMSKLIQGWEFIRYKINQGNIIGASLSMDSNHRMNIRSLGFSPYEDDFESSVKNELNYEQTERIKGARDYMAIKNKGNVFMIIDTDEIPILDVSLIDAEYNEIINKKSHLLFSKEKRSA